MYSRSPPTGTPLAILLTFTPVGLISLLIYIAVVSPSRLELVATITSSTSLRSRSISSFNAGRQSKNTLDISGYASRGSEENEKEMISLVLKGLKGTIDAGLNGHLINKHYVVNHFGKEMIFFNYNFLM